MRILQAIPSRRPTRKSAHAKLVVQTADVAANRVGARVRIANVIAAPWTLNPAVLDVARTRPQLRQSQSMKNDAAKVAAKNSPGCWLDSQMVYDSR